MGDISILAIGILILVSITVGFFLSKKFGAKDSSLVDFSSHEQNLKNAINDLEKRLTDDLKNAETKFDTSLQTVSTNLGVNKGIIEQNTRRISESQEKLFEALAGSKRMGIAGELLLENLLESSGLVKGKQWVQNQNYQKDGKTLHVEFGIVHPKGSIMPIDSHWPKDLYEQLNEIRKQDHSEIREVEEKAKFKELIKAFGEKAKSVNQKYLGSEVSAGFACVYVPSESLYLELNTHVAENKELWISEIHKKFKVVFLGPSTFSAFVSAILLGFNSIAVEEKAQVFLKYLEKFKIIVSTHHEELAKYVNKIEAINRASSDIYRTGERIKTELEKIDNAIKDMNEKGDKA